jgi:membrane protease YdiL (CAAX protease family)
LSHVLPYVALAIFPIGVWLALNPLRFSWGFHHGLEPLPAEMVERAEIFDRYMFFLRYAITIAIIAGLMFWQAIPRALLGLSLDGWKINIGLGVFAGTLRLGFVSLLHATIPSSRRDPAMEFMRRGSVRLWFFILLAGAFAEEFWIAFCLIAFQEGLHSMALSVALVAIVFGLVHLQYGPWGALATALLGAVSGLLFLWTQSLFGPFLFHFIGNLGGLYWWRRQAQAGASNSAAEQNRGTNREAPR